MFDAKVKVLSEYMNNHVKEEQTEMFPKARMTNLDMKALGAAIAERKAELKPSWPLEEDEPGLVSRIIEAVY